MLTTVAMEYLSQLREIYLKVNHIRDSNEVACEEIGTQERRTKGQLALAEHSDEHERNGGVRMVLNETKRKEIADNIIALISQKYYENQDEAVMALYQVSEFFQVVTGKKIPEDVKKDITERLENNIGKDGAKAVDLKQDRWESQRQQVMYG